MNKIDIHNLTKKQRRQMHSWLRAAIQLLYFLFLPSAYTAAFAGVKYIFTQLGAGEKIGLTSFVSVLIVLCLYTIVFGRFFCGFACAFGSFGDAVHAIYVWVCKKMKKKTVKLPEKVTEKLTMMKYVVLAVIVILCFKGVYSKTQGCAGKIFLPFSVPNGSRFLMAADASVLYIEKRTGTVHQRLQCLHKTVSVRYRSAGGRIHECQR